MGKKATQGEQEIRTAEVYKLLLGGASRAEILARVMPQWDISARSVDTLLKRARAKLAQDAEPERAYMRGLAVNRLTEVYKRSMKVQDYRVALSAQKQLSDLLALETPKTLKVVAELLTPADAAQLAQLLNLIGQTGHSAGDLFAIMMEEIAQAEQEARPDE